MAYRFLLGELLVVLTNHGHVHVAVRVIAEGFPVTGDVDAAVADAREFNRLLVGVAVEEQIEIGHGLALLIEAGNVESLTVDLDLKVGLTSLDLAQASVGEVKNLSLRLEGVSAVALNASSEKRHLVI